MTATAPAVAPDGPVAPRAPLIHTDLVLERLGETLPGVRTYGLLDFAAARAKLQTPCVAVLPVTDAAEPNEAPDPDGVVVQRVTPTVTVVIGVSAPNDLGGIKGKARDGLTPLVEASRLALIGWAPGGLFPRVVEPGQRLDERWTSLVFRRGRLLAIEQGRAWWQDEYSTSRRMTGRPAEPEPVPQVRERLCLVLNDGAPEEVEI